MNAPMPTTDAVRLEIIRRAAAGESYKKIAAEMGIPRRAINDIALHAGIRRHEYAPRERRTGRTIAPRVEQMQAELSPPVVADTVVTCMAVDDSGGERDPRLFAFATRAAALEAAYKVTRDGRFKVIAVSDCAVAA